MFILTVVIKSIRSGLVHANKVNILRQSDLWQLILMVMVTDTDGNGDVWQGFTFRQFRLPIQSHILWTSQRLFFLPTKLKTGFLELRSVEYDLRLLLAKLPISCHQNHYLIDNLIYVENRSEESSKKSHSIEKLYHQNCI